MLKFFEASVSQTLSLLREHLSQCRNDKVKVEVGRISTPHWDRPNKHTIQKIFLVGGLGSSTYLKDRIESYFKGNIRVFQPPDAY